MKTKKADRRSANPGTDLTPVQQLIADEVADLLACGEDGPGARMLVAAAARHKTWRWARHVHGVQGSAAVARAIAENEQPEAQHLEREMTKVWRASRRRRRSGKVRAERDTATARIRAAVMEELRYRFEAFMVGGRPEEHRVLRDVLTDWDTFSSGREASEGELPLADAFHLALEPKPM